MQYKLHRFLEQLLNGSVYTHVSHVGGPSEWHTSQKLLSGW